MMPHIPRRAMIGIGAAVVTAAVALVLLGTGGDLAATAAVLAGPGRGVALVVLAVAVLIGCGVVLTPHVRAAVRAGRRMARRFVRGVRARLIRRRARRARTIRETAGAATSGQRWMARLVVAATVGSVLGVAGVAVVLNFSHGMDVATFNGEGGWRAWLYPVTADGLLISTSMVLVWQLLVRGHTTWEPQLGFVAGIAASAGTNVLSALHEPITGARLWERIGWTVWPTMGLLIAHGVLLMFLMHFARVADLFGTMRPDPAIVAAQSAQRDAEQRADTAGRLAAEQLAAASARAAAEIDEVRTTTAKEIEELREQLEAEQVAHAEQRRRLHQEQAEERAAVQQELDTVRAERDDAQAARARVEAELEELSEHGEQDADNRNFAAVATAAARWVESERRTRPYDSLVTEVADLFAVSPRWVQKRVQQATQQHRHDSQLAIA